MLSATPEIQTSQIEPGENGKAFEIPFKPTPDSAAELALQQQQEVAEAIRQGRRQMEQQPFAEEDQDQEDQTPPDAGPNPTEIRAEDFGLTQEEFEQKYVKVEQPQGMERMQLRKEAGTWHAFLKGTNILTVAQEENWSPELKEQMRYIIAQLGEHGRVTIEGQTHQGEESKAVWAVVNGEIYLGYWKEKPEQEEQDQNLHSPTSEGLNEDLYAQSDDLPVGINLQNFHYEKGVTAAQLVALEENKYDLKLADGTLVSSTIEDPAARAAFHQALADRQETEIGFRTSYQTRDAEGNLSITLVAIDENGRVLQKVFTEKPEIAEYEMDSNQEPQKAANSETAQTTFKENLALETETTRASSAQNSSEKPATTSSGLSRAERAEAKHPVEAVKSGGTEVRSGIQLVENIKVPAETEQAGRKMESGPANKDLPELIQNLLRRFDQKAVVKAGVSEQEKQRPELAAKIPESPQHKLAEINQTVLETTGIALILDPDQERRQEARAVTPETAALKTAEVKTNSFSIEIAKAIKARPAEIINTLNSENQLEARNQTENSMAQNAARSETAATHKESAANFKQAETRGQEQQINGQEQQIKTEPGSETIQIREFQKPEIKLVRAEQPKEVKVGTGSNSELRTAERQVDNSFAQRIKDIRSEAVKIAMDRQFDKLQREQLAISGLLNRNEIRRPAPAAAPTDQQNSSANTGKSPLGRKPAPARQLRLAA